MPSVFTFIPICGASFPTINGKTWYDLSDVVIPDLWGKFSDTDVAFKELCEHGRNPRFVGQVFRRIS